MIARPTSSPMAVLFDADGVLIDACSTHREALRIALEEHGLDRAIYDHMVESLEGRPTLKKLEILNIHLAEHGMIPYSPEVISLISARKQEITRELFQSLHVDKSKIQLITALQIKGFRVGVASNSLKKSLCTMLERTGIAKLVDVAMGNDEVDNPKPAPDLYLKAAHALKVKIGDCVIIEDSDIGMMAAEAASPRAIIRVQSPVEVNCDLIARILAAFYA